MPVTLLPASAAAFAPRSPPTVVLNSKVDPWLTATLKRINRIKRPLNSVPQHFRCLTETLSSPTAIWTLCSIMLSKAPDSELRRDDNPLVEALFNYQLVHVEAYVVHVDMVSQNEVAFKLTPETIETLVEYHKDIYSVDTAASTWNWSEKEVQLKKLQEDFVQAANKFVYRTNAIALEGLEEDGAGELLSGGSEEVKTAIMGMFLPLLPPPPRVVDVVRPAPILPSSTGPETNWWQQQQVPSMSMSISMSSSSSSMSAHSAAAPLHQQDPWKVVPSSPSNTTTASSTSSIESHPNHLWANMSLVELQLPSPAPSYSQPFTNMSSACYSAPDYYSTSSYVPMTCAPTTTMMSSCGSAICSSMPCASSYVSAMPYTPMIYSPSYSPLPLPSQIAQQCSVSAGGFGGFGGFGWDRYQEYAMPYATTM